MNIRDALRQGTRILTQAGSESPGLDAQVLLLTVLQAERTILISHPERELTPEQETEYNRTISERALGKPVSYITGTKEFMGLEFLVNEAVLIPRPETEVLVEEALKELEARSWKQGAGSRENILRCAQGDKGNGAGISLRVQEKAPRVLDLCTGSGAIAISIKRFVPEAEVTATDLSEEALEVAKENARRILGEPLSVACGDTSPQRGEARFCEEPESALGSPLWGELSAERTERGTNVRFLQGDLFEALPEEDCFDLILSNPPYIPNAVVEGLAKDVKDFEPRMALEGGEDGLDIYRRLIPEAAKRLAPGGILLLEIGHDQGETVPALCRQAGLTEITVLKDLAGLDRVVKAKVSDKDKRTAGNNLVPSSFEKIAYYETLFDKLREAVPNPEGGLDTSLTKELREALRLLEDYYSSGQWLVDYEADEAGAYPPELKRGVLSQDGLYELLSLFNE